MEQEMTFLEKLRTNWDLIREAVSSNYMFLIALVLLLLAIIAAMGFRKIKFTPRLMANVALSIAISVILSNIKFFTLPQGGSVTALSMLPIFLVAFAYGPSVGFLAGFIFGIIQLFLGAYMVHPVQVLFDYPLPFMALGAAGFLPRKASIGVLLGGVLRFLCHVISGVVFFAQYAPEGMNPLVYSMTYNAPIVFIELALIIVLLFILPMNRLVHSMNREAPEIKAI